jgi:hypothetical protein
LIVVNAVPRAAVAVAVLPIDTPDAVLALVARCVSALPGA